MMRLTDKKLAELERMDREASDDWTGVYDAFDGVSTLKTGRITLTSDATDARDDVFMACAARNALPSLLAEVRELLAYKAQVERVKACDFCCGYGALPSLADGAPVNRRCDECEGLP